MEFPPLGKIPSYGIPAFPAAFSLHRQGNAPRKSPVRQPIRRQAYISSHFARKDAFAARGQRSIYMNHLPVKLKKLRPDAHLPQYATSGSAAADLYAALDAPVTLAPGERFAVPTGIAIAPESDDVVALIFGRSGLGTKFGVTLANSVGVVDSDYRGEIKVALVNHGSEPYTVQPGDRIAQLMFAPILHALFSEADTLDETERGTGGFGSTGKS